ncbi:hypothetical protein V493_00600 [Pseudogymnoascus sp. VKM F-4281 (FW-2241)]|nr:hypothetical protein V493_00600 [Pseudogymnoascus sp. VKM F-4281 (FW-2241)]
MHSAVLLKAEVKALQAANEQKKRRERKRANFSPAHKRRQAPRTSPPNTVQDAPYANPWNPQPVLPSIDAQVTTPAPVAYMPSIYTESLMLPSLVKLTSVQSGRPQQLQTSSGSLGSRPPNYNNLADENIAIFTATYDKALICASKGAANYEVACLLSRELPD